MFEFITKRIDNAIKRLRRLDKITEANIREPLREIRRTLVAADVPYRIAKEFIKNLKEKILGQKIHPRLTPTQHFTKIIHQELTTLMGEASVTIDTSKKPTIIMLLGLQGVGKTTLAGKLAYRLQRESKETLLVSCDLHRPAAHQQLAQLAEQSQATIYDHSQRTRDPVAVAQGAIAHAQKTHKKVIIIDTAGRQVVDTALMEEIATLKKAINPTETLLILDSMMGQTSILTAKAFHEKIDYDGVILTKMDGDTRGGVAIAVRSITKKPIKLISTGEKMPDLDSFDPSSIAKRILGSR